MDARNHPQADQVSAEFMAVNTLVSQLLDEVRAQAVASTGVPEQRPHSTAGRAAMMVLIHACQMMGVDPRYAREAVTALILDTLCNFILMHSTGADSAVAAAEEAAGQFLKNFRQDAPKHFVMRKAAS